ncbi:IclR family transcriptional regulator [Nonomuraea typhae]|uniref:IclR family transcriptional regulator n=1 Tax=Nonomuraea typhae TaxID=2603600 RepID=UPI0012FCA477|nr:IclR family transcriptional regulator [Nonomuraea typhae]
MSEPRSSNGVQSLERAFGLLELMAEAGGELPLSRLSALSGLPLPTIHRIMRTLMASGYVRQLPSRGYALGPRLIRLGETASGMFATWARPILADLVDVVGETANMAVMEADRAVYVAQVPSTHSVRMFTEVGRRVYLHCTGVGKALLAQLPPEDARAIVERAGMPAQTPNTITDPDRLMADLDGIRRRGYCVDDAEQEAGVRCVAVSVAGAPTLSAISVSGPQGRIGAEATEIIVAQLQAAVPRLLAEIV